MIVATTMKISNANENKNKNKESNKASLLVYPPHDNKYKVDFS